MKITWIAAVAAFVLGGPVSQAQNAFVLSNLVSDIPGLAAHTDTNLVNPWGISFSGTSPFWISDNGTGLSTLYNGAGVPNTNLIVQIAPPGGGTPPAAPTGTVFNGTTNFAVNGAASKFIFDTEDGTVSAWASGGVSVLEVDLSKSNAVFKGLASGSANGTNYLYATDFHNGSVVAVDGNWNVARLPGGFADTNIPAGYAPFGIRNIGTNLYVTYALQNAAKHDDVGGAGHGYVDVFDMSGHLLNRLISQGALNSPWGIAMAPAGFGSFGGDLLIGNFGDGLINVFNPTNGAWIDSLNDGTGHAISEPGLWAITFGNGGSGGAAGTLYFTAGIGGGGPVESHGLLGSIAPEFGGLIGTASYHQHNLTSDLAGVADHVDTNLVNPWGISFGASSPFWISDNGTGLSTLYNGLGVPNTNLVVTIPPPAGGAGTAAPTGTVANSVAGFLAGTATAHFIFDTEDGTISTWASGANAVLMLDNSKSNSVFKGLANGAAGGSNYLYATDFRNGQVLAVDTNWHVVPLAGSFTDTNIPAGYAPFGIQAIGTNLYVTYAMQDAAKHDDVGGAGHGYVDVFDMSGHLLNRLISQGALNSPWGIALAPGNYGAYSGALLVGNFGDGYINAYNATNGAWLGPVFKDTGDAFSEPGLWGIAFGNTGTGFKTNTLYFTAGIAGPDTVESHGLFGSLSAALVTFGGAGATNGNVVLNWSGGVGPFTVMGTTNLTAPIQWTTAGTTTNFSLTVTNAGGDAFYRILDAGE
jgi:uncharacterized protein (TIGR03118 family)